MEPFEKHPASPGELGGCAAGLVETAAGGDEHCATTQGQYQPAISHWSGMGGAELRDAPAPLRRDADDASNALAWAGVCAQIWADHVSDFNTEVDRITGELQALGQDWGATGSNGEPPTESEIADARSEALRSARQQWWTAYNTYILDGEDQVVAMLADGPTDEHVANATYHGGDVATITSAITEGTLGAIAGGVAAHMRSMAGWHLDRQAHHLAGYHNGATPGSREWHNQRAHQHWQSADRYQLRAGNIVRTVGARLPVVGLGLTAAGIGYDISQGKPAAQAAVAGTAGAVAGTVAGAVAGAKIGAVAGSFIPIPGVGTAVGLAAGAVVGAGVGWLVSGGVDMIWENSGAIGDAIGAGAEAVGNVASDIGSGAKNAWNSLFG